jgi:hypothetical protein
VTVSVLDNDTALHSTLDPASVAVVDDLDHGTVLSVNPLTGAITYQPHVLYEGTDELTYRVCNGTALCDTATVTTATPPVDLEVTITRTSALPRSGQEVAYDVTVTNLGPRVAEAPLTLVLSASAQLSDLHAAGSGWSLSATHAPFAAAVAAHGPTVAAAAAPLALQRPMDLAVGAPSVVTLTGVVSGTAGAQVRVDAEVSGQSIELVYANNESAALDTIAAAGGEAPPDPGSPVDPTDPTDPDDQPEGADDGGTLPDPGEDPTRTTDDEAGRNGGADETEERQPVPPSSDGNDPSAGDPSPADDSVANQGGQRPVGGRSLAATGVSALSLLVVAVGATGLGLRLVRRGSPAAADAGEPWLLP